MVCTCKCPNRKRQSHYLRITFERQRGDKKLIKIGREIRGTNIHRGHGGSAPLIDREQRRDFRLIERVNFFEHLLRGPKGGGVRTNIDSEVSNGRKEDLDIWTGDEFGVHSSSVFEESAT
jgi:hypothetical protein